jgi:hypothetical protein
MMAVPAAICGSETWNVRQNRKTRIQTAEKISSWSIWIYVYRPPTEYRDRETNGFNPKGKGN